ncbi:NRDE family protein [Domibacillus epiphyticus]|uniref:NRDE family protein n=1 Tax=Domibacillus epiphyticus TaxID=1714355 RepID=A0A1V2A5F1_9BACI|nr:NRDE family protein [Domibacillus epiphyticus]OMP66092.1 hypothetical protein BTO28_13890 [Domibacillus epiphyticus]
MCVINIAFQVNPETPLILAANRDEFYDRPTAPSHWWEDAPGILAGRDLSKGGTWLGVSKSGRICALTNYRDPSELNTQKESRGSIVRSFLESQMNAETFLEELDREKDCYPGFNIVAGTKDELFSYSNKSGEKPIQLPPGIHSVSNAFMNTPWPKTVKAKKEMERCYHDRESLFSMLADETQAADEMLPKTGVSLEWERLLSPLFIKSKGYGTRCSTVIMMKTDDTIEWEERIFDTGEFSQQRSFTFKKV